MTLHLYTDASPNGFKATITLEELGLPYRLHHVRVEQGDNRRPKFLALNPHGRIPVLVDEDSGLTIFESAAILLYLAEKTKRLLPEEPQDRWSAITWLMFHSASMGPAFGNRVQYELFETEKLSGPIDRFRRLTNDALAVLDQRLAEHEYLAGKTFSVADIATFGWMHIAQNVGFAFNAFIHVTRWFETVSARPAVKRGVTIPERATGA